MEILLFSLGTQEIFGINVFKVREVSRDALHHQGPNMPAGVEGSDLLRGNVIPVLALAKVMGIVGPASPRANRMMVTEYSKRTWASGARGGPHHPRRMGQGPRAGQRHLQRPSLHHRHHRAAGRRWCPSDVETILASTFGEAVVGQIHPPRRRPRGQHLLRGRFHRWPQEDRRNPRQAGVRHKHALNGLEAWTRLEGMAATPSSAASTCAREVS